MCRPGNRPAASPLMAPWPTQILFQRAYEWYLPQQKIIMPVKLTVYDLCDTALTTSSTTTMGIIIIWEAGIISQSDGLSVSSLKPLDLQLQTKIGAKPSTSEDVYVSDRPPLDFRPQEIPATRPSSASYDIRLNQCWTTATTEGTRQWQHIWFKFVDNAGYHSLVKLG